MKPNLFVFFSFLDKKACKATCVKRKKYFLFYIIGGMLSSGRFIIDEGIGGRPPGIPPIPPMPPIGSAIGGAPPIIMDWSGMPPIPGGGGSASIPKPAGASIALVAAAGSKAE